MKRYVFISMILALVWAGAAWAQSGRTAEEAAPRMRVALVASGGSFQDASFNQGCREGIERLLFSGAPIYAYFCETEGPADYERKLTELVARDYRLIIAIGNDMTEAVTRVAEENPRSLFAIVDGYFPEPPPANVWSLNFSVDQCAFPAGYLAAAWAALQDPADPAVAYVSGIQNEVVDQFIVPFENGVKHYNQAKGAAVRIFGGYAGAFDDPEAGAELANRFMDEGADVIFGVASLTSNGSLQAAKKRGKWAIGVDTDQYETLPEVQDILLTSCVKRMDRAVEQAVMATLDNEFLGGTRYMGTVANRGVSLAPYHDFEEAIPEAIQNEILTIKLEIVNRKLMTGWESNKK